MFEFRSFLRFSGVCFFISGLSWSYLLTTTCCLFLNCIPCELPMLYSDPYLVVCVLLFARVEDSVVAIAS